MFETCFLIVQAIDQFVCGSNMPIRCPIRSIHIDMDRLARLASFHHRTGRVRIEMIQLPTAAVTAGKMRRRHVL